jgi:hypothetical protein
LLSVAQEQLSAFVASAAENQARSHERDQLVDEVVRALRTPPGAHSGAEREGLPWREDELDLLPQDDSFGKVPQDALQRSLRLIARLTGPIGQSDDVASREPSERAGIM